MYSKLYRSLLFPLYETKLRRRKTLKYLEEYEKNQWLSEEELREIQWAKLQELLNYVYIHVPYYKRRFNEIGANPQDFKNLDDFSHFPFLTKRDIQENQKELISDQYINKKLIQNETSGSTGDPLIFYYNRESYERRIAVKIRSESFIGLHPGVRSIMLWGHYISQGFFKNLKKNLYWKSQNIKYVSAYQLDEANLHRIIRIINWNKPEFIISYVTPIYLLSQLILDKKIPIHSPKGILASAEMLYPHQKSLIEEGFHTKVYNRYGCCEFMNIAAECTERSGMHINIDNLAVEFVDPEGDWSYGDIKEIIVTDLHNYAMPFIRYRLGDLCRPLDQRCLCGRGLPVMDIVQGRVNDVIYTPDGRRVPDQIFLYIFAEVKGVRKYQVHQEVKEMLTIKLVTNDSYSPEIEKEILKMARNILGNEIKIIMEYCDDIPISPGGKFRYTCSKVSENCSL